MKQKRIFSLKNLKITMISIVILDFLIAIISPILVRYGYSSAAESLFNILYNFLIPLTGFLMIFTFICNIKNSYTKKRTAKQELDIKQKFWGRISLLAISALISFVCTFLSDLWLPLMFLLFILSFYLGPSFGRLIIRK
jgi:hypothetical protein